MIVDGGIVTLGPSDTFDIETLTGTYQVYIPDDDGAAYFGAGAVKLDDSGITVSNNGSLDIATSFDSSHSNPLHLLTVESLGTIGNSKTVRNVYVLLDHDTSDTTGVGIAIDASVIAHQNLDFAYGGVFGVAAGSGATIGESVAVRAAVTSNAHTSSYGVQVSVAPGSGTNAIGISIGVSGATNNIGIEMTSPASGSGDYALKISATAQSVHAGRLRIGSTTDPTEHLDVTGNLGVSDIAKFYGQLGVKIFGSAGSAGTTGSTALVRASVNSTDYTVTIPNANDTMVLLDASQTLTNKTLTTPTISATGFNNAQHAHAAANSGGQISYDNLTSRDHGASDHTNRTRHIYLPAAVFTINVGTPDLATRGDHANAFNDMAGWALDGAATESVSTTFVMPADWDGSAVTPTYMWAKSAAGSGNVVLDVLWANIAAADQIDEAATSNNAGATATAVPGTVENLTKTTGSTFDPGSAGELIRLAFRRQGAHASDTYNSLDIWFFGILIEYTADM